MRDAIVQSRSDCVGIVSGLGIDKVWGGGEVLHQLTLDHCETVLVHTKLQFRVGMIIGADYAEAAPCHRG
jgi:hypothetical protein